MLRLDLSLHSAASTSKWKKPRLLDGRSDAVAAYSFRKLRSAYLDPLITLREDGGDTEQSFNASNTNFVSPTALSAFANGNNLRGVRWNDQVAGHYIAQSTEAAQPGVDVSPLSFVFDGSNDYMQAAVGWTIPQPWTFYIVYRRVSGIQSAYENVFDGQTADRGTLYRRVSGSSFTNGLWAGGELGGGSVQTVGTRGRVIGTFNGANSLIQVGNNSPTTGNASTNVMDGLTLGGQGGVTPSSARFSNIEVHELIMFSGAHDADTRAALGAEIDSAWSLS